MFDFRRYYPPTPRQLEIAVDDFAELLSTDRYSLNDCARIMGVSSGTACVLLHTLCQRYGEAVAA